MDRKLLPHRADSLQQHGFLVLFSPKFLRTSVFEYMRVVVVVCLFFYIDMCTTFMHFLFIHAENKLYKPFCLRGAFFIAHPTTERSLCQMNNNGEITKTRKLCYRKDDRAMRAI